MSSHTFLELHDPRRWEVCQLCPAPAARWFRFPVADYVIGRCERHAHPGYVEWTWPEVQVHEVMQA